MNRTQAAEFKYLMAFLLTIIVVTALLWGVMELSTPNNGKRMKLKKVVAKNLAPKKETNIENVPIVSENFETYQFKDPFQPLSEDLLPEENKLPPEVSSGTGDDTGTDTGGGTTTGIKMTTGSSSIPKVIDIKKDGDKSTATLKVNGKTYEVGEGDKVENNTVIDINKAEGSVEFLQGDQKYSVSLDKG